MASTSIAGVWISPGGLRFIRLTGCHVFGLRHGFEDAMPGQACKGLSLAKRLTMIAGAPRPVSLWDEIRI